VAMLQRDTTDRAALIPTARVVEGAQSEWPTVLHIFSGDLWAGAEVVIFNLLRQLNESSGLRVVALSLNEGLLVEKLRAAGVFTHVIPEAHHSFAAILVRMARLFRGQRVAAIHSHRYKENLLAWLLARWIGARDLFTTVHGLPEPADSSAREARTVRWRARLDYAVVKRFRCAVAVSEEMKAALIRQYGFRAEQLRVIHNGAAFPPVSFDAPNGLNGDCFHIGTVARLVPIKGLDLFLDAAAAIRREAPEARFSVLGDGPLRANLMQKAADLRLQECVTFLSPRPDPIAFYRTLHLYLNTSLHEGIPLSMIEAMACGTPVVSSAVGGIPEIVTDAKEGFLVKRRDADLFARRCLGLMRDDGLRRTMGAHAAVRARSRFSTSVMAGAYRQLYDDCFAKAGNIRGRSR